MHAAQQLQTLEQLGIDVWLPTQALPGARAGAVYALTEAAVALEVPAARPAASASAPSRSAASLWQDDKPRADGKSAAVANAPVAAKRRAENVQVRTANSVEKPQKTANPPAAIQASVDKLELHILDCPGQLLLVDEAHQSLQQQQLLGNMLFALGQMLQLSLNAQPVPFSAVELSRAPGVNPQAVLEGLLHRRLSEANTQRVLLMGETPSKVLASHFDSDNVRVVSTVSSAAMLRDSALKAQVWQCLQAFKD